MMKERRPWVLSAEFLKAIEEKNVKRVNAILDNGFDLDINLMFCKNAINICVSNGWYEMAQLLIRRGCSLSLKNDLGQQPLTVAILKSDYGMVKLLVDNRADKTCLDLQGKSALHYACELNNLRIVQLLTEQGASQIINMKGHNRTTPLFCACKHGGVQLVKHLISKGADVNAVDYFRDTPLFSAVCNMQCTPQLVEALLDAGAHINHINRASESVLLCAFRSFNRLPSYGKFSSDSRFRKLCLLLIDRGCNVDVQNQQQETALHLAVQLGDLYLVRRLMNAGCLLDLENKLELVPLFYACQSGIPALVTLLVEGGADTRLVQNASEQWPWHTQLSVEERGTYPVILEILQKAGRCQSLGNACRRAIRQALQPDVEKRAMALPLPRRLKNFILLADFFPA